MLDMSFEYKTLTSSVIVTTLYTTKVVNRRTAFPEIGRTKGQVVSESFSTSVIKNNTCSYG